MADDLTKKQKKRQVKRIHKTLFEYHEEEEATKGKKTVSLRKPYQDTFNKHFPTEVGFSIEELENRISECIDDMTDMLIEGNDAINHHYAHGVVTNIILQFVGQAIDIETIPSKQKHADNDVLNQTDSDFMYS